MLTTWKTQQWPQDWERSVFIPIPKKGNAKQCLNYCTITLILHWQPTPVFLSGESPWTEEPGRLQYIGSKSIGHNWSQHWPQDWKRSVFIPIAKKGNAKEYSNYHTIALISHTSKVMLKILQARLPQYVNCELPDVQAGFRKGRGTRDQIANIRWIIKKAREF